MAPRPDALFHPLYLSPRRGLDVDPYAPPPTKRSEVLDGPARPVRDRAFHVEHLALALDVDVEQGRFSGVARLTLRPVAAGLRIVTLDASELRIGRVVRTDGRAGRGGAGRGGRRLAARLAGDRLSIRLDRAYGPGETVTIAIAYRARRPRRGLWFIGPDPAYPDRVPQAWSQGQAEDSHAWFPCVDHPNDKFTTEVVVTAGARFRTVANGRLLARRRSADGVRVTWHWKHDRPLPAYLVTLVVAPLVETRARAGRVPLRFYAFAGQGRAARRLYGRTADMMRVFTRLFGPYPWREYSQVVVSEFTWGGMENAGATTLTEKAILDDRAALDLSYEGLVSHELAHQWWGDLVTCRGWHHNWLNESWATLCEALYDEVAYGPEAAAWTRIQKSASYLAQDLGQYRRPIVCNRYVVPTDLFDRHAYEKGSLVLAMLRDELGDELFFRGGRRYLARHAHGLADTHEFRRAFEEESGRDLTWFFDQWVWKAGYPEIEVGWRALRGGEVAITVRQRQRTKPGDGGPTPAAFRFGLDIVVHGARGARTHRVTVSKAHQRFVLAGPGRTVRIAVDPAFRVLKTLALAQPVGAWLHALARDRSPSERMRAARELAVFRMGPVLTALARAVARDRLPQVRMAAAIALGEAFGGGASGRAGARATGRADSRAGARARVVLERAARDRDPHVRRAAVFALGLFGRAAEKALLAALEGERSYLVKAMALKALARTGSGRLLATCRVQMEDRGYRDLVPMAALDALAMAKPAAAFDDGYAAIRYGETQEVREAGVRLLVALARDAKAKRARREQARHVVPTLVALLDDPSVFLRLAAMQGAGRLRDRSLLPALRRSLRHEAWDHLQRTAQKAIAEIRRGGRGSKRKT